MSFTIPYQQTAFYRHDCLSLFSFTFPIPQIFVANGDFFLQKAPNLVCLPVLVVQYKSFLVSGHFLWRAVLLSHCIKCASLGIHYHIPVWLLLYWAVVIGCSPGLQTIFICFHLSILSVFHSLYSFELDGFLREESKSVFILTLENQRLNCFWPFIKSFYVCRKGLGRG